jgi:hypothetical protein
MRFVARFNRSLNGVGLMASPCRLSFVRSPVGCYEQRFDKISQWLDGALSRVCCRSSGRILFTLLSHGHIHEDDVLKSLLAAISGNLLSSILGCTVVSDGGCLLSLTWVVLDYVGYVAGTRLHTNR